MARDITTGNFLVSNKGMNPVVNFNFMVRVEGLIDLPCKSVKAFSREMEYEYIQEGGVNDYVHMRRKPITKPFTLEIERYTGIDYFDPLPNGLDLVLPLLVFVSRYQDYFIPGMVFRTYIFTGCTVIKKTYGELNAEHSGLLTETTTIAYREMLCVDLPWSEVGGKFAADTAKTPSTNNLSDEKEKEAALEELERLIKEAEQLKKDAEETKAEATAIAAAAPPTPEGEEPAFDYAAKLEECLRAIDGDASGGGDSGALTGAIPNADKCLELCKNGKSETEASKIRDAARQAGSFLGKARSELNRARGIVNEMKSGAPEESPEIDLSYWDEITRKQAEALAEEARRAQQTVDEDYWDEIEDKQVRLAEDPDNRSGTPDEGLDPDYWDEIEDKQARLAEDPDNIAGTPPPQEPGGDEDSNG